MAVPIQGTEEEVIFIRYVKPSDRTVRTAFFLIKAVQNGTGAGLKGCIEEAMDELLNRHLSTM